MPSRSLSYAKIMQIECIRNKYIYFLCRDKKKQTKRHKKTRYRMDNESCFWWALTDSNRRPSACKADALNQLS